MGEKGIKPIETKEQQKEFSFRLLSDIQLLDKMVAKDLFEKNTYRIGAEQEFCIVSKNFRPVKNALPSHKVDLL